MRPRCPACGAADVVPMVYGFPSPDMLDAAERREIVLGGCIVDSDSPGWCCVACRLPFGPLEDDAGYGMMVVVPPRERDDR